MVDERLIMIVSDGCYLIPDTNWLLLKYYCFIMVDGLINVYCQCLIAGCLLLNDS